MIRLFLAMAVLMLPWLPSAVTRADAAATAPAHDSWQPDSAIGGGIMIGAYDPGRSLAGGTQDFDTWFVRQDDFSSLAYNLSRSANRSAVLMTVEPWVSPSPSHVLVAIAGGEADDQIRQVARIIAAFQPMPVMVRWGHEMDIPGLYPWSVDDSGLYKLAFRRFVSIFRSELVTNAKFVWSPAANDGFQAFYPGNDVVDYVGVTILEDPVWDSYWGSPPKAFVDHFRPVYPKLAAFGKPVLISELGVSGTPDRQRTWLRSLVRALPEFPALKAIGYFNDVNAANNHVAYLPDWRLSPDLFSEFADSVRASGL